MRALLKTALTMGALLSACATANAGTDGVTFGAAEPVLAGPVSEIRLTVSPDGSRQLWGEARAPAAGGLQIFERRKIDNIWSDPASVPFNTPGNDFDPAFAPDGSGVWFFSDRQGGAGGDDLWFAPLENGEWGAPRNAGKTINTAGNEWAPTPLEDGRLLFSSDGHGGFGGQDLFVAARDDGGNWRAPRNLGEPVNSTQDDYDAALLPEGALVFTRSPDPENGSTLYYSCATSNGYAQPRNAGSRVNLDGGWALGPSVSVAQPGVLFFSGRSAADNSIQIYRVRYVARCRDR